jgi:hypothetical protein
MATVCWRSTILTTKEATMVKTKTIAGGVEYAGVADRLKEFRENNPRAKITTTPTMFPDGSAMFQTSILQDKADENSAEATGSAMYSATEMKKQKAFEKLETISVGRALALLGYLNNGEIATNEELQEFEQYKDEKVQEQIELGISLLESAETIDELKKAFVSLGALISKPEIIEAKDRRKEQLNASATSGTEHRKLAGVQKG